MIRSHIAADQESLDKLAQLTEWTPSFQEVRRSAVTETSRSSWQRKLYVDEMLANGTTDCAVDGWPRVVRDAILQQHGTDDDGDCFFHSPFPYRVEKCTHCVFFPALRLTNKEITAKLEILLKEQQFVWYENPKPSLLFESGKHYHVFIKN
tara:strand:- start:449 stop:901 length:453 start_codon:yes stop_codon:yes gene_type:complete